MNGYTQFRHLAIENAKSPPTTEEINVFEEALGAKLPPEFLDYLEVANGGYVEYEIDIPMENGAEILSFCTLFRTSLEVLPYSFLEGISQGKHRWSLPKGVLPFAEDGGGSTLFLDLTPEGKGKVVAFIVGLPAWASANQDSQFIAVADSFLQYIDKLYIDRWNALGAAQRCSDESQKKAMRAWLDIGLPEWRSDPDFQVALGE